MNKKGFTLVELLATITIIGIVVTMVSINISKAFEVPSDNQEIKSILEEAACVYVELDENKDLKEKCLSTSCLITSSDLIKAKLIYPEDVKKEEVIEVKLIDKKKVCTLKEEG